METFSSTGAARVGSWRASWPFARLTATRDMLQLNVTIVGKFVFRPGDIVSIEPSTGFLAGGGVQIRHRVAKYPRDIIFWGSKDPWTLIDRIESTGFLANRQAMPAELETSISRDQAQGGFPLRTAAALAVFAIYLVLYFGSMALPGRTTGYPGGADPRWPTGFLVVVALALLVSPAARRIMLKEGRQLADIRVFLYFLLGVAGLLFLLGCGDSINGIHD